MGKLYNIGDLSGKWGGFPDKWSIICLCHWTVPETVHHISEAVSR